MSYWLQTCWPCLLAFLASGIALGMVKGFSEAREGATDLGGLSTSSAADFGVGFLDAPQSIDSRSTDTPSTFPKTTVPQTTDSSPVVGLALELAENDYPVEEIEGIGPAFGRALRAMGIATTREFVAKVDDAASCVAVAAGVDHDDVDSRVVKRWRNMADLCQIQGVRGQFAELLEFAGVNSVAELADQEAEPLLWRITELNQRENRSHQLPRSSWVEDWIAQARGKESSLVFADLSEEAVRQAYEVEEIEGIGPGYGRRLRELGIHTTLDLLERGRLSEERAKIALAMKRPDVDQTVVQRWVSMADLMRVEGIMGQFAELLNFSGINSLNELGKVDPERLLSTLKATNERENRVKGLPASGQIRDWIRRAAGLESKIQVS